MYARRAADYDHVHWLMREEAIKIDVGSASMARDQSGNFLGVTSADRGDVKSGGARRAHMRFRDVAAAGEACMQHESGESPGLLQLFFHPRPALPGGFLRSAGAAPVRFKTGCKVIALLFERAELANPVDKAM